MDASKFKVGIVYFIYSGVKGLREVSIYTYFLSILHENMLYSFKVPQWGALNEYLQSTI